MGLYQQKHDLFHAYRNELAQYAGAKTQKNDGDAQRICDEYISSKASSWHNIFVGETLVGFLIMGKDVPLRHPDAVRSVAEAYILPEYRKQGLAQDCLIDYMGRHPGVYSVRIQAQNQGAIEACRKAFQKAGYKETKLAEDKLQSGDENTILLAFQPGSNGRGGKA